MSAVTLPFRRRLRASPFALLSAGFALMSAAPALADAEGLNEIVVVGQKSETSIQKAPESITALSAAAMEQNNIVTPMDLNGQVPGLVMTTSEGYDRSIAIRGIGFNVPQDDAAQPSVSYHEDGIYIANPVALNSGFLDVDHIEVLRGPQGTVFGQNSIGGTINVITKAPTFDGYHGFASLATGSYALLHTSGAINVPLSDDFAIRLAGDQVRQDGYVKATQVPGSGGDYPLSDQNNYHARLTALWQPTQDLSVEVRGEFANAHQHETQGKNINDPDTDPYHETSDWPGKLTYRQELAAATINYDMGFAKVKSLTSWQAVNQGISVNEDGLDLALMSPVHDVQWFFHNSQTFTQEVDVSSEPGGKLDWIVGSFYLHHKYKVGYDQYNTSVDDPSSPNLLYQMSNPSDQTINDVYDGHLYFQSLADETRESYSFYGQTTYHLLESLRLTAGVRYTSDHNTTNFSDFYNLYGPPIFVEQTATKVTWRAGLDYDLTDTNLLYASISTGFKPGGGNISLAPAVAPYQFQPETITAYELGSKNSFMDKKLTVNLSSFYYTDKNQQFQAEDLINFQGGVDNIPKVEVYGIEGEVSALLPYHIRFDANMTAEKSKILSHFMALDNDAGAAANATFLAGGGDFECIFTGCAALNALRAGAYRDVYGNPSPMLPEVTAAASLTHTLPFGDGSSLLSRVQVQYRDSYADTIFGKTATYTAPSYKMLNLYFDYTFANGDLDASLAISNLLDEAQVSSRFTNQFGGETTQQYAPPREFIFRVGYQF